MKTRFFCFTPASVGAFLICVGLTNLCPSAISAYAEEAKATAPQVVLAETYNAVTKIYFTNTAVHKGSHKPGLVERRFRADVKYRLMDAKYYERREPRLAALKIEKGRPATFPIPAAGRRRNRGLTVAQIASATSWRSPILS
jgi:hypothetical protein